uniref:Uncharacterized protein n=1 Tax=Neogobius melanostomus TaxID=47308 RepID=A0A8C6UPU3_9GOBI
LLIHQDKMHVTFLSFTAVRQVDFDPGPHVTLSRNKGTMRTVPARQIHQIKRTAATKQQRCLKLLVPLEFPEYMKTHFQTVVFTDECCVNLDGQMDGVVDGCNVSKEGVDFYFQSFTTYKLLKQFVQLKSRSSLSMFKLAVLVYLKA